MNHCTAGTETMWYDMSNKQVSFSRGFKENNRWVFMRFFQAIVSPGGKRNEQD